MNKISRIIRYIKIHALRDPKYFCHYAINYFNLAYVPRLNYFEQDEITKFIEEGKSIIRFGDGEVYIFNEGDLPGQVFDEKLKNLMLKSFENYTESSHYVLCLNKKPLAKSNLYLRKHNLLSCWLPSKVYINLYLNKACKYFDAAMFYANDAIPNYFEDYLLQKNIVLVTNNDYINKFKSNQNIPFKDVSYVETPSKDAFAEYEKIKESVLCFVNKFGKENCVVMAAFGPSSKALAYELSSQGIQVMDIGQGLEVAYSNKELYSGVDVLK
jgi:hypothetical protein